MDAGELRKLRNTLNDLKAARSQRLLVGRVTDQCNARQPWSW